MTSRNLVTAKEGITLTEAEENPGKGQSGEASYRG